MLLARILARCEAVYAAGLALGTLPRALRAVAGQAVRN